MFKKIKLLSFVLLILAMDSNAQPVISQQKWQKNSVAIAGMNQRISDAAEKFKQYGRIPKIAFYDVGYPKDEKEFDELNGYGFLLVVALAQDEKDLPLKRVFVSADGKETELKLVKTVLSKSEDTEMFSARSIRLISELWRASRFSGFDLRMKHGDLVAEFGLRQEGAKMASSCSAHTRCYKAFARPNRE